jgi:Ferritin-like domain
LIAAIENLGGRPVTVMSQSEYANTLNAASLKSQGDVVELARKLELGAVTTYLGVIPAFKDGSLAKVAERRAADKTLNWVLLSNADGKPLPSAALYFCA